MASQGHQLQVLTVTPQRCNSEEEMSSEKLRHLPKSHCQQATDTRSLRAPPWSYKKPELFPHTGPRLARGALPRWPNHSSALEIVKD